MSRSESGGRARRWGRGAGRGCAFGLLILLLGLTVAPASAEPGAEIAVQGSGWLRDRELRFALQRVLSAELQSSLDANAIEDAAVILVSALQDEGFQTPRIEIEATLTDGTRLEQLFDPTFASPLPRPINAREVRFRLTPGVRSHVAAVTFDGLTAIPEGKARSYFRTDATLLATARANAYSPGKVSRAADALLGDLRQAGYVGAEVKVERVDETAAGAVALRVQVQEGRRWVVASLMYQREEDDSTPLPDAEPWIGRPWSPALHEDIREAIRQRYYVRGHPDVGVHVEADPDPDEAEVVRAEVIATVVRGREVAVGQVRFPGRLATRESVLRRRVALNPGDPLNPIALERARYRISRLGVFESVDLRYEPDEGGVRDAVYLLREGSRYETHVLFGYGSYEQLRAGVEHRQMNIFGLAHQSRLELVQSFKSTSGNYTYTVPELFGESLDGTARLFGLQREEVAFTRQEFGLTLSFRRPLPALRGEAKAGYTFEALRNRANVLSTQSTDDRQINVASVNLGIFGDARDNPLRPRRGYTWSAQTEAAAPALGGEATYQRFEFSGSYHTAWGGGRWIHLGFSQGLITTVGSDDATLPLNKRFYPGGDNSIRGYQRGEAAPRAADGRFVGAKAYTLLNVELEQALTSTWSVVAFIDALGGAMTLRDWPFEERLYAVGLGVRYQTLIGPVRLEYGRNLEPRPGDPSGTWHLSVGYPF